MPMLLFNRLLFVAELFAAEFLLGFHLRKRSFFVLRLAACVGATCLLGWALPLYYNAFYTFFTFLLIFAVTVPMLKLCYNESWIAVLFCGIAAYTMQHFAYGVASVILTLVEWGQNPVLGMYFDGEFRLSEFSLNNLLIALIYILAYFVSYVLLYVGFGKKIKYNERLKVKSTTLMVLVGVALAINIFLNTISIYFGGENIVLNLLNTVYESLCGCFLLYALFNLIKTGELKTELDLTQTLLHEKERQYNLVKENVDLINIKCHDLRHQIRIIGEGKSLSSEAVREIESAISIYDADIRTDNEVLDVILTEKSLKCAVDGIELSCVADGHSLDFMDKTDVYSLFGNALDNAINAVTSLEKDKRSIGLVVRSVGNMVSVNVHNYFDGKVRFDGNGIPVTAKNDRNFHGFGMKSIKQIAEKYGGAFTVSAADNIFTLNVLISQNSTKRT